MRQLLHLSLLPMLMMFLLPFLLQSMAADEKRVMIRARRATDVNILDGLVSINVPSRRPVHIQALSSGGGGKYKNSSNYTNNYNYKKNKKTGPRDDDNDDDDQGLIPRTVSRVHRALFGGGKLISVSVL